ncbi:MAG: SDR family NAD(P)-dependent oxidoreductase, partial [Geminicoccaceae bacterium]
MTAQARALAGRHAVVTGAGRGIGAAIATALAAAGARLTLMGRTLAPLQERAAALPAARAIACDVTDEKGVAAAFGEAVESHGPVAILINNAG